MSSSRRLFARASLAAVAVLALALLARRRAQSEEAHAARTEARVTPVTTARVERRDVPIWLDGLGSVAAWQAVTLRPQVDGRLERVFFTEGQKVRRGQLLAQIDPRPFAAKLEEAKGALLRDKAQLLGAQANLSRYRRLAAERLIAQQQADDQATLVDQTKGAVAADEAAVQTARLNLDYAQVRAPLDGVVGVRQIDVGNLVHANDATGLVVLTQLDPVALFVTLPEDTLPAVSAALRGGPVACEAWSRQGQTLLGRGTLLVIDNQINAATATLRLKCRLPNPDRQLWPNQFVKARVLVKTRRGAIVIPPAALQRGPEGALVYVVVDGKAVARPVEVGLITDTLAVIEKGLAPAEVLVTEGQAQLRPGAPVVAHLAASGTP